MRKLGVALFLAAACGLALPELQARHRRPARVCEIVHPAYYYQSFGQRRHGRYALRHFQTFHHSSRYYGPGYRLDRGRRYLGRRPGLPFRFDLGRRYRAPQRYYGPDRYHYRDRRPRFRLHLEF